MKKNIIYIVLACIALSSCTTSRKLSCPTLDKAFFYKQAGQRPTFQFMRNHVQ